MKSLNIPGDSTAFRGTISLCGLKAAALAVEYFDFVTKVRNDLFVPQEKEALTVLVRKLVGKF